MTYIETFGKTFPFYSVSRHTMLPTTVREAVGFYYNDVQTLKEVGHVDLVTISHILYMSELVIAAHEDPGFRLRVRGLFEAQMSLLREAYLSVSAFSYQKLLQKVRFLMLSPCLYRKYPYMKKTNPKLIPALITIGALLFVIFANYVRFL